MYRMIPDALFWFSSIAILALEHNQDARSSSMEQVETDLDIP
jgi:hypothetical protein